MFLNRILCFVLSVVCLVNPEVPRPRGVAISKASFYASSRDFTCFDGSVTIPFEQVNDDYCDCADGSDEPGTSACSNGAYHCTNAGYVPFNIQSSRVNDGICDCCDGSDEYDSPGACINTCSELGKAARQETERRTKLAAEGYEIYQQYAKQGQEAKTENQVRLEELEAQKVELETVKNDLEAKKTEAETPEKEAKDKHSQEWEAEKSRRQKEKEDRKCDQAFKELDADHNGVVTVAELQQRSEFDIDSNGEVSYEEAKEHLEDQEQVDYATFKDVVWPNIKDIFVSAIAEDVKEPSRETPGLILDDGDDIDDDEEEDDEIDDEYDDTHDDELDEPDIDEKGDDGENGDDVMPAYDEPTQALIDAANNAREVFREADQKFRDSQKEVTDIQNLVNLDFGSEQQYFPLKGSCYEYTDREYIYKLCPFERATQRSKHGGQETTLGMWGRWDGTPDDRHSAMLYERGQGCWNGPDRSVKVLIECGTDNEVFSASEPNRCEYQFEFRTPAACSQPPQQVKQDIHTEL